MTFLLLWKCLKTKGVTCVNLSQDKGSGNFYWLFRHTVH